MNVGRFMVATADGPRWKVTTKQGHRLGSIEWNAGWRTFEFVPQYGAAFTPDCLRAMAAKLEQLTSERLRVRAAAPRVTP